MMGVHSGLPGLLRLFLGCMCLWGAKGVKVSTQVGHETLGADEHAPALNYSLESSTSSYQHSDISTWSSTWPAGRAPVHVHIVYFAWADDNGHYDHILVYNLNYLKGINLCGPSFPIKCSLHVELTADTKQKEEQMKFHIFRLFPNATVNVHTDNQYEYWGINRVYEVSRESSGLFVNTEDTSQPSNVILDSYRHAAENTYVLYFHDKGATHSSRIIPALKTLHLLVLSQWKDILDTFMKDPSIHKIGFLAGDTGLEWFNFWWVRASYISETRMKPYMSKEAGDRWYYEGWLGERGSVDRNKTKQLDIDSAYSLLHHSKGKTCPPEVASVELSRVLRIFRRYGYECRKNDPRLENTGCYT
ncbi:hypothetical protein AAMO2058_000420300 [Amorphochlora amoebiformis]